MCLISYDDEPDPDEPDPDEPDPGEPADRTRGTAQAPSTVQARSTALVPERRPGARPQRGPGPCSRHSPGRCRPGRRRDAPARDARPRPGLLSVPVRATDAGPVLRMFRTPLGERTAVGFTARDLLAQRSGPATPRSGSPARPAPARRAAGR
ncbi:hypothetical protein SCALM49S_05461 [Streptomyces californicus]